MSEFGIDYAFSHPSISAMNAAGVKFVCRYLSNRDPAGSGLDKTLSVSEAKALRANGFPIVLVFETTAGRATEGRNAGGADAVTAVNHAKTLGAPSSTVLYFAVDADVSGSSVDAYFRGANAALPAGRVGAYAGIKPIRYLFDKGLIAFGWQTYAWSGGAWDDRAKLQQYRNGVNLGGADVDYDRRLGPVGWWSDQSDVGVDVISCLTQGERSWVLRLAKYRANARKRGSWIESERLAAERIKDQEGAQINKIEAGYKGLTAAKKEAYLASHHRRERLRVLRNSRANRPLDTGF